MDFRTWACFALSRRLMTAPAERQIDYQAYDDWRISSLSHSWSAFSDSRINDRDVLDFGCGDGQLSLFLATKKRPRRVVGIDINPAGIERARANAARTVVANGVEVEFILGSPERMPLPDCTFDTIVAFDCLEHVMAPEAMLKDWHRVLRPGGRCLIEWYPFKGPWGPHMESLIPIPWAHVIFGEQAMFRAAEAIYDLPEFRPRHWDLDTDGNKKPNKWRAWSSFREQAYVNELTIAGFRRLIRDTGLRIARLDHHGFSGNSFRKTLGHMLMSLPVVGEYFTSYVTVELERSA